MTLIARLSRLLTDKLETLSAEDREIGFRKLCDKQTDHSELGKYVAIAGAPSRQHGETSDSEDGPTRTVKAIALIALTLSLLAIATPVEQFAVAIPAVILAIATGYCGERIYTAMTAAVTALNLAMLSPHDDLIMAEQPIQIYWTAMMWSAAPIFAMVLGYFGRLAQHRTIKGVSITSQKQAVLKCGSRSDAN